MTIASLVVRLSAETADFHRNMEAAARRIERVGKQIARAGLEISQAISLPIVAAGAAAFKAALEESHRAFGPLYTAWAQAKAAAVDLFTAVGRQLTPVFLQMIEASRSAVEQGHRLLEFFRGLPPGVQKAITSTLLFLAALGPTIVVVGKLIKVIGAIPAIFAALTSPIGLALVAVAAFAAAALYVVTHWEQVKLRMVLVWTAIKEAVFDAVDGIIGVFQTLTGWIPVLGDSVKHMRESFDAWADQSLARSAALIQDLEKGLNRTNGTIKRHGMLSLEAQKAIQDYNEAIRQLNANQALFGNEFNKNAASAAALKAEIEALIKAGVGFETSLPDGSSLGDLANRYMALADAGKLYDEALNALGPTLQDHARLLEVATSLGINLDAVTQAQVNRLKAYGSELAGVSQSIQQGVGGAFEALGTQLGSIFAGIAHGFKNFGAVMEGLLGGMLTTLGQVLIAYGVAGIAIKKFIANPFAAIAAGVALIALGSALSSAAQKTLNASEGGGGPVASPSATATGGQTGPSQQPGTVVLELRGDATVEALFRDTRNQDALAKVIQDLTGRGVIVLPPVMA